VRHGTQPAEKVRTNGHLPDAGGCSSPAQGGPTLGGPQRGAAVLEREHGLANPWRTLASREVYTNPWITVREDEVLRPDGSPGIYGVVSTALAVGVLALTDDEHVVLVGQWRYTLDEYSWELVEGGAHDGEDGLAAARRELREEAGYEAAHWERLGGDLAVSNSVTDERAELWVARGLTPVPADPDPTEALQVRHVPVDEAVAMVARGELTDVLTVVGLLTFDRLRSVNGG
jgi:8-oxo-dGTP pyrophosphatase MutT (NUDIX family)